MTPEAQRIAIAKACGWTIYRADGKSAPAYFNGCTVHDNGNVYVFTHIKTRRVERLPNYLDDLNAMHEAEKVLTHETWTTYSTELQIVAWRRRQLACLGNLELHSKAWINADASEKAEAILRTLNLWDDSK